LNEARVAIVPHVAYKPLGLASVSFVPVKPYWYLIL